MKGGGTRYRYNAKHLINPENKKPSMEEKANMADNKKLIDMYRRMVRIRVFEERVAKEFAAGNIPGFVHLYSGEEAVAVGACANLKSEDYITSTHRGHGHLIAKGGKTDRMMAELYGKKTGYNKGKGGSMHIADTSIGILGANGIVGGGITIAGGAAVAAQMKKTGQVAICFLGDGASNSASFHEGVNLASCWKLPIVYVIENNLYAESTCIADTCNLANIADRSAAYGIPGVTVDGNDVMAVYEAAGEAVDRARKGSGPSFVECNTYRHHGHYEGDTMTYRTDDEVGKWKKLDPISRFRKKLTEMGTCTDADLDKVDKEINAEIDAAVKYAAESPAPDPKDTLDDVFVEVVAGKEPSISGQKMKEITFLQAMQTAVDEEMARDSSVFVIGEDVRKWGAPFGEYAGLCEKYGPERVKDTPISEIAILGGAIGAAAAGLRPIANIMFCDFFGCCGDQLINQLQMRYMYGGMLKLPLTIMAYSGAGLSAAAQHSKSLYGWLIGIPGLKVIAAADPYDLKGLLKSAIREDNPVVSLHHKAIIFSGKGMVPEAEYTIPLGKAAVKKEGKDITVVAMQLMVPQALAAAEKLEAKGISVEVIDPRTVMPLDTETILKSVKKTGRLVITTEEPLTGSAAGEIAAVVASEAFDSLKAPIKRVCAPDTPIPFAPVLEKFWMPNEEKLVKAINEITK